MGIEVALGLGLVGAAGLYGAKQKDNAQKRNEFTVDQHYNDIKGQAQSMMQQPGSNPYQNAFTQFLGLPSQGQSNSGANVNQIPFGGQVTDGPDAGVPGGGSFAGFSPELQGARNSNAGAGAPPGVTGGNGQMLTGYNTYNPAQVGQGIDPLTLMPTGGAYSGATAKMMEILSGNAPGYSQDAGVSSALSDLLAGNSQFDNSAQYAALAPIQQRQAAQQIAGLQGSFGSLGQRFGTNAMRQETDLRAQIAQNQSLQNQQIASTSFENSQNRRLGAIGQGISREGAQAQAGIAGYQARLGGLQGLAGLGLQGGQLQLGAAQLNQQGALANQQAQNQAGQFNAQAGNDYTQNYNNYMMQALGLQNSMYQQGQNYNMQLLGLMNGQQLPMSQGSNIPGAIGDLGQLLAFLPYLNGKK